MSILIEVWKYQPNLTLDWVHYSVKVTNFGIFYRDHCPNLKQLKDSGTGQTRPMNCKTLELLLLSSVAQLACKTY